MNSSRKLNSLVGTLRKMRAAATVLAVPRYPLPQAHAREVRTLLRHSGLTAAAHSAQELWRSCCWPHVPWLTPVSALTSPAADRLSRFLRSTCFAVWRLSASYPSAADVHRSCVTYQRHVSIELSSRKHTKLASERGRGRCDCHTSSRVRTPSPSAFSSETRLSNLHAERQKTV